MCAWAWSGFRVIIGLNFNLELRMGIGLLTRTSGESGSNVWITGCLQYWNGHIVKVSMREIYFSGPRALEYETWCEWRSFDSWSQA